MSSLSETDKLYLEKILKMGDGYVLDYSDTTFDQFFRRFGVDIHSNKYKTYGTSKAKKMRSFWNQERDILVGRVLTEMIEVYEAKCNLNGQKIDKELLSKTRDIIGKLLGEIPKSKPARTIERFLREDVALPDINKLPIEPAVVPVIEFRVEEARRTLEAGAYLSVVVLCGSILEGVLLGNAQKEPARFNRSSVSPRGPDGKG
ncbi:MAG: hypothetical protein F4233_04685 [Rhodospirillaceae bacterium]|nr:hypothetical protein [Rhodospirillaceae bacterium]